MKQNFEYYFKIFFSLDGRKFKPSLFFTTVPKYENKLENLNTSISFEYTIPRIQSLITRTKQVLSGDIERFYFPEEDVPLCVIVNKDMVIEDHDLESIPTPDFLAVLEVYLKEMEEFERTQKTKKELE